MVPDSESNLRHEIGHVLFIDIVGYSKLLIEEQKERLNQLTAIVLATAQVREATDEQLVRLPTGDGMALVFHHSAEEPARCALEIAEALRKHPELPVRMGIHSGPVSEVTDVSGRSNIAGAGINMAQRVMDCGDAGHILLSQHVADDLVQYRQWAPRLHDLGECEVKHSVRLRVFNLYSGALGNAQTPQKFKKAQTAEIKPEKRKPRVIAIAAIALLSALGLIGTFFAPRLWPSKAKTVAISPASAPEKSIAVLPFENLSSDEQNAFFAAGVQDEILTDLAKVADLKVISRTSVKQYKPGSERNLHEIAGILGVANVLEGSVQRVGHQIRVNAQLIDARTDTHLWAQSYDRDLADVFSIQSEIAQEIAEQLRSKLSSAEKSALAEKPTTDLKAYEFYTDAQAIDIWNDWQGAGESATRKIELLEKAIQSDPNFAIAYCALAKVLGDLFENNFAHLSEAKEALDSALRLRPKLGEAHRELARYYYYQDNLQSAHAEAIAAGRTLPNDSETFRILGQIDSKQNRWDEARINLQKAHELDPRNEEVTYHLGSLYRRMRLYQPWQQLLTKGYDNGGFWAQLALAEIKLDTGDLTAAQAVLGQIPLDFSPTGEIWTARFTVALYLRDYDAAGQILTSTPGKFAADIFFGIPPLSWADGWIAQLQGNEAKGQAIFLAARQMLDLTRSNRPIDFERAALLDAGAGRKEVAIQEALRAIELMPMTRDSASAPEMVVNLAKVYLLTGEPDLAIAQLKTVVKIPAGPPYGDLRFNPIWDPLRKDPNFEQIAAPLALNKTSQGAK